MIGRPTLRTPKARARTARAASPAASLTRSAAGSSTARTSPCASVRRLLSAGWSGPRQRQDRRDRAESERLFRHAAKPAGTGTARRGATASRTSGAGRGATCADHHLLGLASVTSARTPTAYRGRDPHGGPAVGDRGAGDIEKRAQSYGPQYSFGGSKNVRLPWRANRDDNHAALRARLIRHEANSWRILLRPNREHLTTRK